MPVSDLPDQVRSTIEQIRETADHARQQAGDAKRQGTGDGDASARGQQKDQLAQNQPEPAVVKAMKDIVNNYFRTGVVAGVSQPGTMDNYMRALKNALGNRDLMPVELQKLRDEFAQEEKVAKDKAEQMIREAIDFLHEHNLTQLRGQNVQFEVIDLGASAVDLGASTPAIATAAVAPSGKAPAKEAVQVATNDTGITFDGNVCPSTDFSAQLPDQGDGQGVGGGGPAGGRKKEKKDRRGNIISA